MTQKMMICPHCWGDDKPNTTCPVCLDKLKIADIQLSDHFWLSEFIYSPNAVRKGIPNDPTPEIVEAAGQTCSMMMEKVRYKWGPLHVNSGYRSPQLNGNTPGASSTSAHPYGLACDFVPVDSSISLKSIMEWIIHEGNFNYDQVIYESTWIHLGLFYPPSYGPGKSPLFRMQRKMMFPTTQPDGKKKPTYFTYNPADPRVI